ncbi:unnamed protein product [Cylicocyclus nassatus]|uniref:Uncharacterized protein n=1 Tax=Cylicocyclus nassatus TaxID=53992 RepID=A0AA36H111_CYLNA|nr:unnamed protein product [Cylicocyclus nassatus]
MDQEEGELADSKTSKKYDEPKAREPRRRDRIEDERRHQRLTEELEQVMKAERNFKQLIKDLVNKKGGTPMRDVLAHQLHGGQVLLQVRRKMLPLPSIRTSLGNLRAAGAQRRYCGPAMQSPIGARKESRKEDRHRKTAPYSTPLSLLIKRAR